MSVGIDPVFCLPIIAPPTDGGDPPTYYSGLSAVIDATSTGTNKGLHLTITPSSLSGLYAMFAGQAHYIPSGQAMPLLSSQAPAGGAIVLEVDPEDVLTQWLRRWPGFAAATILYSGLVEADVRSSFSLLVPGISLKVKTAAWRLAHNGTAPPPNTDFNTAYLDRFMAGTACIGVKPGTRLGTLPIFQGVDLYCVNAQAVTGFESMIDLIRSAPYWLEGPVPTLKWVGHPLIDVLSTFPPSPTPPAIPIPPVAYQSDIVVKKSRVYGPGGLMFATTRNQGAMNAGATPLDSFTGVNPQLFQDLSASLLRVTAAIRDNEGRLEAINTYDNAYLSFGCFQWTAGVLATRGELPALLGRLQTADPATFQLYFGAHGLDIELQVAVAGNLQVGYFLLNGVRLDTAASKAQLREHLWAYRFWRAGHVPAVREAQVRHAADRYTAFYDKPLPSIPTKTIRDAVTSEYGVALLLDEHINRPGHVTGDSGSAQFTINRAISQRVTAGLSTNPTTWSSADEIALLQAYVSLRAPTSMTHSSARANAIRQIATAGGLSMVRGSFQP